jgi:hypothetical protein
MSPGQRVQAQDQIAREYNDRWARIDQGRLEERIRQEELRRQAEADAAEADRLAQASWTNGACVYCGLNTGTEMRSMGPVHLKLCLARWHHQKKIKEKRAENA